MLLIFAGQHTLSYIVYLLCVLLYKDARVKMSFFFVTKQFTGIIDVKRFLTLTDSIPVNRIACKRKTDSFYFYIKII